MTHAEKDRLITTLQDAFDLARENQALKETITRKDAEITRIRSVQASEPYVSHEDRIRPIKPQGGDIPRLMAKIKEDRAAENRK